MLSIAAGAPLFELIRLCFAADRPLMVCGKHGVGKSELFAFAAQKLGIGFTQIDLSVYEPPDLIGIPRVGSDGRTHYAPPSILPSEGRGILLIEELNRAPRFVQSPCLQLLTARRINDYRLPVGWLPCSALNDGADGYLVDDLDEALLARFVRVRLSPNVEEWLSWARQHDIHHHVMAFVDASPSVFDDPAANPRAWTYASDLLREWERSSKDRDLLTVALSGVLGEKWVSAFLQTYNQERRPLRPAEIIDSYPAFQSCVRRWIDDGQLDAVAATIQRLRRHIQGQRVYDAIVAAAEKRANVESFIRDLPGDLRCELGEWCDERGFGELAAIARVQGPSA